jgi:hypothetical protein
MAGGSPEHHVDRVGYRLGDYAGDPVLAASCRGIEGVASVQCRYAPEQHYRGKRVASGWLRACYNELCLVANPADP